MAPKRKATGQPACQPGPRVRETRSRARAIQNLLRDQPSTSTGGDPRTPPSRLNNIVRGRGRGRGRGSGRGRGRGSQIFRQNPPSERETDTDAVSLNAPEDDLRREMDGELQHDDHSGGGNAVLTIPRSRRAVDSRNSETTANSAPAV